MSLIQSAGAGAFLILGPTLLLMALGTSGFKSFFCLLAGLALLWAAVVQILSISRGPDPFRLDDDRD